MSTWVLVLTIRSRDQRHSFPVIPGFSSEEECIKGAEKITRALELGNNLVVANYCCIEQKK